MIRAPSKTMEKEIIARAERLAKDPGLALPVPVPPLTRDPFEGKRRKLERISRFAGDEKRLKFYSNWGDQISKAYAGTLMLGASGKAPYLITLKLPQGDVPFAIRGRAKKEKQAGMQWYDHPVYRLLLYVDMAARRPHFHFYSTPQALYCSGREPGAPKEYVAFAMPQVKAGVKEVADGVWACPHLDAKAVKEGAAVEGIYLRIEWRSARVAVGVCDRCARARPGSTIIAMATHMAVPKLDDDFDVAVLHLPEGAGGCEECATISSVPLEEELRTGYLKGELEDAKVIERHMSGLEDKLKAHEGTHFVLDGRCYGTDCAAFVEALSPSEEEGIALRAVLPNVGRPLILDGATPSKVLAELWGEHGSVALGAVVGGDEELRDRYMEDPELAASPSKVLRKAMVEGRKRNIIARLPSYGRLPAIARFADSVARAYRTEGAEGAVKTLERERVSDHKVKSVAYAFLLIVGKEANKEWQYDRTEKEFAQFLRGKVQALLVAGPEGYHEALQALLSATGSTERLPEPKPPEGG
jgi:hypothetical protein